MTVNFTVLHIMEIVFMLGLKLLNSNGLERKIQYSEKLHHIKMVVLLMSLVTRISCSCLFSFELEGKHNIFVAK